MHESAGNLKCLQGSEFRTAPCGEWSVTAYSPKDAPSVQVFQVGSLPKLTIGSPNLKKKLSKQMNLYPCENCGRLMVLREPHEAWKTRCVLCWKRDEGRPFNGADLYIFELERRLEYLEMLQAIVLNQVLAKHKLIGFQAILVDLYF